MSEKTVEIAHDECTKLRASLCQRFRTEDDAVAIASMFAMEAARIFRALGGEKMVAAQFYHIADEATNKLMPGK